MYKFLHHLKRIISCTLAGMILLLAQPGWAALPGALQDQERLITGRVTSADDGMGFPGVNIVVKGTTIGTTTDSDGKYSLRVPSEEAVLVLSAIGYATQEVAVGSHTLLDVALEPDITSLAEVVVVGYGVTKKSDVTGSIAKVTTEQIRAMPFQNSVQALQGRAAGIDVTSNVRPGEMGTVRVRGVRSIAASSDPLYVVDGIPLQSGGIDVINPNDIESMEVLKDASASAIYGSRASNGVILITTKKGKTGKAQVTYNGSIYFEKINDLMPMFNAPEYAEYRRDAYRAVTGANNYTTPYPNPKDDKRILGVDPFAWESIAAGYTWADKATLVPVMRPTTAEEQAKWGVSEVPVYDGSKVPTTNWTDYVERTGVTQDHTVSVSTATDKFKAYFSGGLLDQKGTNIGQDYKRYTGRVNLELQATDWLTIGANMTGSYAIQNYGYSVGGSRGARTLYESAKGMLPFAVPYDTAGNYIFNPGGNNNIINPIRDGEFVINERTTARLLGSFFADIKITNGLRFRTNFGPDVRNFRNGEFQDRLSALRGGGASSSTHMARYNQQQELSWTLENLLFYDKTFNDNHKIGVTLLQSSSLWRREESTVSAVNLPYSSQLWYNLGSTTTGAPQGFSSAFSKRTMMSYMARVNYTLRDKYLLTVSGRYDGSSVLVRRDQWDFFPSFALAWKMNEESFMKDISWITEFKPRVGLGTTGTESVRPYSTKGGLLRLPYVFGSTPANAYVPSNPKGPSDEQGRLAIESLRWEKTTQWNVGIDFGFIDDRITGSIDYYIANTSDLLLDQSTNAVSGYKSVITNVGKTQNKGIELLINSINVHQNEFKWTTNVSFSKNVGQIVESYNGKNDDVNRGWFIGEPIGTFYDYKKIGIWQDADAEEMKKFNDNGATYKAGDIRVEDVNGDYRIDLVNDRQVLGNTQPKWTGGITNTFNYKNWELSAFVYARWGQMMEGGAVDMQGLYASRKVDYWRKDNPTNAYPRADFGNGGQPIHYSAMNYVDGSFVKVRYISLAYVVPQSAISRLHLNNVKIYTQVLNPFLYAKTDYLDPDASPVNYNSGSNNSASGVSSRSYVLGLNVSF